MASSSDIDGPQGSVRECEALIFLWDMAASDIKIKILLNL